MRVLVTGPVASGKSALCAELRTLFPDFVFINISDEVLEHGLFERVDEVLDTHIIDDDRLVLHLRERTRDVTDVVFDHHSTELFSSGLFSLIVVLSCIDADGHRFELLRRLRARGYSERKVDENMAAALGSVRGVRRFRCAKLYLNSATESPDVLAQHVADAMRRAQQDVPGYDKKMPEKDDEEEEEEEMLNESEELTDAPLK